LEKLQVESAVAVHLPAKILETATQAEGGRTDMSAPSSLLSRFLLALEAVGGSPSVADKAAQVLCTAVTVVPTPVVAEDQDKQPPLAVEEMAAAFLLTGWNIKEERGEGMEESESAADETAASAVRLECDACLACAIASPSAAKDGEEPARKKRRITDRNVAAHRYYCPWICGFPCGTREEKKPSTTMPLWKVLADRWLAPDEDEAHPASRLEVYKMLRAGLSSQHLPKDLTE
jgi:hypothetical protein